ncbi:hypothetical protein MBLNU13_g11108t1 [Cladosporium sp. NU13]
MDTSLINLLPNLTSARRSTTLPRWEFIDPPPPYTLAPHPSPQREDNARSVGVPLHIELLGAANLENGTRPVMYSGDDSIALGPDTTHAEFLDVLQRKLSDVKMSRESKEWKAVIVAEFRGRKIRQFEEQVVDDTVERWRRVLRGLGEGRFRGVRVICWRGEDGD